MDPAANKDQFWEQLRVATEEAKGTLYILRNFNSRVGTEDQRNRNILGKYGE